jgi:hypothetical protein
LTTDLHTRGEKRGEPKLSDAIATTGAIAIAIGVLLIAIDTYAGNSKNAGPAAMFGGLAVAGYLVAMFAPSTLKPAGITAVVIGLPAALGWWLLPGARDIGDVRPFLILTIVAMALAFIAPSTRGRAIFVAVALIVLWLWIIGEVSGTDSYSAAPIPSPPAHTTFSLSALKAQTTTLSDLDSSDPLYPTAVRCASGDMAACDRLYRLAPEGSDFQEFGASCGQPSSFSSPGECEQLSSGFGSQTPTFTIPGSTGSPFQVTPRITSSGDDHAMAIGIVSLIFGVAYLAGLFLLDQRKWSGLATAFVVPAALALFTGTEEIGNAVSHAWVGGFLTVAAGFLFGVVGHLGQRRFTAWFGAFMAAFGTVTIALDASNLRKSVSNGEMKLAGPGFIVLAFGAAFVLTALLIARLLDPPPPAPAARVAGPPPEMPGGPPMYPPAAPPQAAPPPS